MYWKILLGFFIAAVALVALLEIIVISAAVLIIGGLLAVAALIGFVTMKVKGKSRNP